MSSWKTIEQQRAYNLRYIAAHRDELREKARARYLRNRDLILAQRRAYRADNLPAIQQLQRAYLPERRARRHGLTDATVARLYAAQGGKCAICREPRPLTGRNGLAIDHDHGTEQRRGLICRPCNIALPAIERFGVAWAERAAEYLASPPLAVTWADMAPADREKARLP